MRRLHWWGWIAFLISSALYVGLGIRDGDWLMTAGSAAFLIGVLLLMTPGRASRTDEGELDGREDG